MPLISSKAKVSRTLAWIWRSTIFLITINLLLLRLVLRQSGQNLEQQSEGGPINSEMTLDSEYFQDAIDSAQEIFDFMRDQRIGKAKLEALEPSVLVPESHWCWKYPNKPYNGDKPNTWKNVHLNDSSSMEAYIFSAYLDKRPSYTFPRAKASVQVLTMARRFLAGKIYCQIWFDSDSKPKIVTAFYREIWQRAWDPRNRFYSPWLITCPVMDERKPAEVSLTFNECEEAQSVAGVLNETPPSLNNVDEKVVVCVKGMDFLEDNSARLIEWLELQFILGADRVVLYTYYVHPKTQRVISYYVKKGRVLQIPLILPGNSPNSPFQRSRFIWRNRQQKRRNEIIPYNDCLYRHLNTHAYLLIVDTDEAVVPIWPLKNWSDVLNQAKKTGKANGRGDDVTAFSVRNAFFFDNLTQELDPSIPENMHMLRHNMRSAKLSAPGNYGKSFVYIPNVASVFNHFPLHKQRPGLNPTKYLSPEIALKLHYKKICPIESRDECPELYHYTVRDKHLDQFATRLIDNVDKVIKDLLLG